jgi:predicted outer membrane repeat protein
VFDGNRDVAVEDIDGHLRIAEGGAIHFEGQLLLVEHCRFARNEGTLGGAIYAENNVHNLHGTSLIVTGSQFMDNKAFEAYIGKEYGSSQPGSGGAVFTAKHMRSIAFEGSYFSGGHSAMSNDGSPKSHCANGWMNGRITESPAVCNG